MDAKSKLWALVGGIVFSNSAVWLILFNGFLMSPAGGLSGYPGTVLLAICLGTAITYYLLGRRAFDRNACLLASSVGAGIVLPGIAVAGPILFCILVGCRGFDFL
jgi:hypothetical protein